LATQQGSVKSQHGNLTGQQDCFAFAATVEIDFTSVADSAQQDEPSQQQGEPSQQQSKLGSVQHGRFSSQQGEPGKQQSALVARAVRMA